MRLEDFAARLGDRSRPSGPASMATRMSRSWMPVTRIGGTDALLVATRKGSSSRIPGRAPAATVLRHAAGLGRMGRRPRLDRPDARP